MAFMLIALEVFVGFSLAAAACPAGTIQGLTADTCYQIPQESLSWGMAEQLCVSKGGHLVSVTSDIADTFLQSTVSLLWSNVYWIGGYYSVIKSNWVWSDGARWSYTQWAKGQPSSSDNYCVSFNATSGQWFATACDVSQPYLCKVPPAGGVLTNPSAPPSLQPPATLPPVLCPAGWFSLPSSELCYLVVQTSLAWQDASNACNNDNGQLASITSPSIQQELQSKVWTLCYNTGCWIGLHINQTTNDYQWTDGSPVEYTNWEAGQPANPPGIYVFLDIPSNDAEWSTSNGNTLYYICEQAPYKICS